MTATALPPRRPFLVRWLLRLVGVAIAAAALWVIDGSMVAAVAVLLWAVVLWAVLRALRRSRHGTLDDVRRSPQGRTMRWVLAVGLGSQMLLLTAYFASVVSEAMHGQ